MQKVNPGNHWCQCSCVVIASVVGATDGAVATAEAAVMELRLRGVVVVVVVVVVKSVAVTVAACTTCFVVYSEISL